MRRGNPYILLPLIFLLAGCNLSYFEESEFGEFTWDGSLAIPLGEINYTVEELFSELDGGSTTIRPGDENVVSIVYEQRLDAQTASDFLQIQDQVFNGSLPINVNLANSASAQNLQASRVFEFDLAQQGNEAYDSIYFNAGDLAIDLNSSIAYPVSYSLVFRSLEDNGERIISSGAISSGGSISDAVELNEKTGLLNLDAAGNVSSNKFVLELTYNFEVPAGGNVSANQSVDFNIDMLRSGYSDLFGFVGNQNLDINLQEVELDFFNIFSGGELIFTNPKVDFIINNSFGFPIGIDYSGIRAIQSDGTELQLTGEVTLDREIVEAPTIDQKGSSIETLHRIDRENSNLNLLFSSQPTSFRFDLTSVSNPDNAVSQYNFINENNILEALALIEIPLDMVIDEVGADQGFPFNSETLESAKRALMKISSSNQMPLGGNLEIQFLDDNGNIVFTIDQRPYFNGAEVGADGRTIGAAQGSAEILLEDEDLRRMEGASSINVRALLSTTDADQELGVKFFDDYILNIKVALQADVELKGTGG